MQDFRTLLFRKLTGSEDPEWQFIEHLDFDPETCGGMYYLDRYRHRDGRIAEAGPSDYYSDPDLKKFLLNEFKEIKARVEKRESIINALNFFSLTLFGLIIFQAGLNVVNNGAWVFLSLIGVFGAFLGSSFLLGYKESRKLPFAGIILCVISYWLITIGRFRELSLVSLDISLFWLSFSVGIIRMKVVDTMNI